MTRFENWLRGWLNRRWRRQATAVQVSDAATRAALDDERLAIAGLQQEIVVRLAFLIRAEREDGWERAELQRTHLPKSDA